MEPRPDGTDEKTELSGLICHGRISADWNGKSSNSMYLCNSCLGVWPWEAHMLADTPHREVLLKAEYKHPLKL
jgi:hypothetical protein